HYSHRITFRALPQPASIAFNAGRGGQHSIHGVVGTSVVSPSRPMLFFSIPGASHLSNAAERSQGHDVPDDRLYAAFDVASEFAVIQFGGNYPRALCGLLVYTRTSGFAAGVQQRADGIIFCLRCGVLAALVRKNR